MDIEKLFGIILHVTGPSIVDWRKAVGHGNGCNESALASDSRHKTVNMA